MNCRWTLNGVLILFATLAGISCSTESTKRSEPGSPSRRLSSLNQKAAATRAQQIENVSYSLWFNLEPNKKKFQGRTTLLFDLRENARSLSDRLPIDFEEGEIQHLVINGQEKTDLKSENRFDGHHIYLRLDELAPANRIEISYTHPYSTNGNGLHRFKDPADDRIYLYSNFEPYNAHRMFPCFDQPDLKATYEVTVEAPENWQIISNTLETEVNPVDHRKTWIFPKTRPFSTYVFALHAGDYTRWKSSAEGIPLRLFARKSLSPYVDHEEWLRVTRQGLAFFQKLFDTPYPFGKYDQILVPDFNSGAMENVGAVTFSENYVPRTHATFDVNRGRAKTILHEMAHMWFGDLVTLKWWNGLWLNESFATVLSVMALDQGTSFEGGWLSFLAHEKQGAYFEDQLVTTHPIELPVPDTEAAQSNFDSITYGKGAAVLTQLSYYIGHENFIKGLRAYFKKYAFKNTQLSDFIGQLSEASGRDLSSWQQLWLQTSGVNTLRAEWKCDEDPKTGVSKISEFQLLQTGTSPLSSHSEDTPPLRPHRTEIALFRLKKGNNRKSNGSQFHLDAKLQVEYSDAQTRVSQAIGKPCPDVVSPNFEDNDYVKVELDPVSLSQVTHHLAKLPSALDRQLIWQSLWEMVLDGKLKAQTFADIVLSQGEKEDDTQVLGETLGKLAHPSAGRLTVLKFLPTALRNLYQSKFETFTRTHLLKAKPGSDLQLVWYQAFLYSSASPESLQFLTELLDGKQKLKGIKIDQERRWQILLTLARNGFKSRDALLELIQAELKKDPTDIGEKKAIAAQASIPDPETKNLWLARITRDPSLATKEKPLPLAKVREAMWNYQLLNQEKNIRGSVDSYFSTLKQLAQSSSIEDIDYANWFSKGMFPSLCENSIVERTTDLIENNPNLPATVVKNLKVRRQIEERCIRVRKASEI